MARKKRKALRASVRRALRAARVETDALIDPDRWLAELANVPPPPRQPTLIDRSSLPEEFFDLTHRSLYPTPPSTFLMSLQATLDRMGADLRPQCAVHDDCREHPEIGRACFASSYPDLVVVQKNRVVVTNETTPGTVVSITYKERP